MSLQAVRIGLLLALIAGYSAMVWKISANVERGEWLEKENETRQEIARLNNWAQQKTEESTRLSNEKQAELYDKQLTIDDLSLKLRNSLAAQRVPVRSACVKNRVSKTGSASVSVESATGNEFTTEFREFLLSSLKRGDEAGIYAEIAHEWAVGLCKRDDVICK